MKTIIAGGRDFTDYELLKKQVNHYRFYKGLITEIVSGCAKGADYLGEQYALENGIPLKYFPADWDTHGRAAGPIRNKQMADYADALIVVWDGSSRGTKNMIDNMHKLNKPVFIVWYGNNFEAQSNATQIPGI